jgi:uncharacterized membrane protein YfcA
MDLGFHASWFFSGESSPSLLAYGVLFLMGSFAGVLNVVAGGGSFLTLPLLVFLGLPPSLANGTNRVGIVFQNAFAVWSFHRHDVLDWGSVAVGHHSCCAWSPFRHLAGIISSRDHLSKSVGFFDGWDYAVDFVESPNEKVEDWCSGCRGQVIVTAVGFFLIGIYGGFVQAGVGFFILAVTSALGFDLVRGNGIKWYQSVHRVGVYGHFPSPICLAR